MSQAHVDRTQIPPPGPPPTLRVPAWTETSLANGARLVVSEKHALPLVAVTVNFQGGANQFEPAAKHGVAPLVAAGLSEGTTTHTGDQLSEALQLLGTSIETEIGPERGLMRFVVLTPNFAPALGILAEELLHPTFPAEAVERWKAQRLVSLQQEQEKTTYLARSAFKHVVYGPEHPYGWIDREAAIGSLTRDDALAFHRGYFRPAGALITVVGDITPAGAKQIVEGALAGWSGSGSLAPFAYPALRAPTPTTIYIVDKAGAAQSSFSIGLPGPPRSTPDYYALEVMNEILGALFQSRLNHAIREEKG